MMSELVSSSQLAEMALPILPKSKQGIEHVAKRDGWSPNALAAIVHTLYKKEV